MRTDKKARIRRHILRDGRAFIPGWRMRQIKWEEAVVRAACRRRGITDPKVTHFNCGCGSLSCLGNAIVQRSD